MQPENKSRLFGKNPRFLVIALVFAILLTAAMGTMAWIRYIRSLQTVTLVHVSDHNLLGPDGTNTGALNLSSIDVSTQGPRCYAFGVQSTQPSYRIQLGYTTNILFSYSIHPASETETETRTISHQEAGTTLYYNPSESIEVDTNINGIQKHDFSYKKGDVNNSVEGTYSSDLVQAHAEPKYWQSVDIKRTNDIDFYILEITWPIGLTNNKETDMIYLTAGAARGG